ncbi:hypoxanthine phosphoribosyltransferase [Algoriphagus vanfongensis]|uniref:hypoxanthine phosphoribosyltransferase n=1 Tax=Algoriphagus vanfongensis TaxID=426371 RepID=UPI000416B907|nr:hypoxanthine phosphoribosyltransferase [Algoriphagus vanfongensis]
MAIKIKDKEFEVFISKDQIRKRLKELGIQISKDFDGQNLVLIGVLNGSFIVMADLCREIKVASQEIKFLKISSYSGTHSTGVIKEEMGFSSDLKGKNILIVEDIVDTGESMNYLLGKLKGLSPASVSIATLLYKPEAFRYNYPIHYVGFEIPNKFVVGYGLDYDGMGRELPDIYQLA